MSFELAGIGVSGGIVIGRAFVLERFNLEIPEYNLPKAEIEQEVLRLQAALSQTREQLLAVRDAIPEDAPQDTAFFINAHLLMLDDSALRERPMRASARSRSTPSGPSSASGIGWWRSSTAWRTNTCAPRRSM